MTGARGSACGCRRIEVTPPSDLEWLIRGALQILSPVDLSRDSHVLDSMGWWDDFELPWSRRAGYIEIPRIEHHIARYRSRILEKWSNRNDYWAHRYSQSLSNPQGVGKALSPESALRHDRKIVVVGEAGSGKTTLLLSLLQWCAAGRLGDFPNVPFYLEASEIDRLGGVESAIARAFEDYSGVWLDQGGFQNHIDDARLLVLIDNMDEVESPARVVSHIEAFCARHPETYVMISARSGANLPFLKLSLRGFSPAEVSDYIANAGIGEKRDLDSVYDALDILPDVYSVVANPAALGQLVSHHSRPDWTPFSLAETMVLRHLYLGRQVDDQHIARRHGEFAWLMATQGEGSSDRPSELSKLGAHAPHLGGIIHQTQGQWTFRHDVLRPFYAAHHLAEQPLDQWRDDLHRWDSGLNETLLAWSASLRRDKHAWAEEVVSDEQLSLSLRILIAPSVVCSDSYFASPSRLEDLVSSLWVECLRAPGPEHVKLAPRAAWLLRSSRLGVASMDSHGTEMDLLGAYVRIVTGQSDSAGLDVALEAIRTSETADSRVARLVAMILRASRSPPAIETLAELASHAGSRDKAELFLFELLRVPRFAESLSTTSRVSLLSFLRSRSEDKFDLGVAGVARDRLAEPRSRLSRGGPE